MRKLTIFVAGIIVTATVLLSTGAMAAVSKNERPDAAEQVILRLRKTNFQRDRRKFVFTRWDSIPNPLNSPMPWLAALPVLDSWYIEIKGNTIISGYAH